MKTLRRYIAELHVLVESHKGWITVKGSDRHEYMDAVWEMYSTTYAAIGLIVPNVEAIAAEFPIWDIYLGKDDKPVAFTVSKTTAYGVKRGLSGTDGSPEGKAAAKAEYAKAFFNPGVYSELSHGAEHIALKSDPPVICAIHAAQVLGKPMTMQEDRVHYTRNINGKPVTKIMIGRPKGIPTTSIHDPKCETAGTKEAKDLPKPEPTMEEIMDEAEHYGCMLDLWKDDET